jgi:hypothetical protein
MEHGRKAMNSEQRIMNNHIPSPPLSEGVGGRCSPFGGWGASALPLRGGGGLEQFKRRDAEAQRDVSTSLDKWAPPKGRRGESGGEAAALSPLSSRRTVMSSGAERSRDISPSTKQPHHLSSGAERSRDIPIRVICQKSVSLRLCV